MSKSNIPLDRMIAEEILGVKVIGKVTCCWIEGSWDAYPGSRTGGWAAYSQRRPVYLKDREKLGKMCQYKRWGRKGSRNKLRTTWRRHWREKLKNKGIFRGHMSGCLEVVLPYSDFHQFALELVARLGVNFSLYYDRKPKIWTAYFGDDKHEAEHKVKGDANCLDNAAPAIAWAALKFHRKKVGK